MALAYPIKKNLKSGLSGIMRVRNEERFIESCIDSCINSLNELIVVYTGCTDNTESILIRKVKQYPEKLKIYKYEYDVLWYGLNREEYDIAINLSDSDPRLYSNLCNFALSKVSYKYVVKIDSDQIYFSDCVKFWKDACSKNTYCSLSSRVIGWSFMLYLSFYRRASARLRRPLLTLLPNNLVTFCYRYYKDYSVAQLKRGKAVIAWSGLNLFYDGLWSVPFDGINIHPPYNGEGDTVIFKLSNETYFSKHTSNTSKDDATFSVTEDFNIPISRKMFTEPMWFHLHAIRHHCFDAVKKEKDKHPDRFVPVDDFLEMSYEVVLDRMDSKAHSLFQRIIFAFVHKIGKASIRNHRYILDNLSI